MNQNNSRENNFNIIRFVAAIMVIYGHMYYLIGSNPKCYYGMPVSSIGVKIFFLISGYLIMQSYLRDANILRYAIRRFFRIVPGLIGVVLFCFMFLFDYIILFTARIWPRQNFVIWTFIIFIYFYLYFFHQYQFLEHQNNHTAKLMKNDLNPYYNKPNNKHKFHQQEKNMQLNYLHHNQ